MNIRKLTIVVLALFCAGVAFGQETKEKEKVAIYTEDKSGRDYADFAGEHLVNAIVKRGTYDAYERTSAFLNLLNKEQGYQRSGAVDDSQIAKLGVQLGVQLVCAVKIGIMDGQPFISAKLIDVESAGIKATARPAMFTFGNFEGFEAACDKIITSMFGEWGSKPTSTANSNNAASSNSTAYMKLDNYGLMVTKKDFGEGNYSTAVDMCKTSRLGGFADWRLPTKAELVILYEERETIGNFKTDDSFKSYYWSSTSGDGYLNSTSHCALNFYSGNQTCSSSYAVDSRSNRLRCVRNY